MGAARLLGSVAAITSLRAPLLALGGCDCTPCSPDLIPVRQCEGGGCEAGDAAKFVLGACRSSPPTSCGSAASCTVACPPGYTASGTTEFTCECPPESDDTLFKQYGRSTERPWLESKTGGRSRRRRSPAPPPPPPGHWSAGALNCTLSACPAADLNLPEHAEWTSTGCEGGAEHEFLDRGAVCVAKCSDGYYRTGGDTTRTCQVRGDDPAKGDMIWSGAALECTKAGTCDPTPDSAAGDDRDSAWQGRCTFKCGAKCSDWCEQGFQRPWVDGKPPPHTGVREYTCECPDGSDPRWKSEDGKSWEACVGCLDETKGAPVKCDCDSKPDWHARNQRGMDGQKIAASCEEGYERSGNLHRVVNYRCGKNDTWTAVGEGLDCRRAAAPPPAPAPGGLPQNLLDAGLSFWQWCGIVFLCGMVLAAIIVGLCCRYNRRCAKHTEIRSLLRQSFLGSENAPGTQLAEANVEARWNATMRQSSLPSSTSFRESSARRRPKGRASPTVHRPPIGIRSESPGLCICARSESQRWPSSG